MQMTDRRSRKRFMVWVGKKASGSLLVRSLLLAVVSASFPTFFTILFPFGFIDFIGFFIGVRIPLDSALFFCFYGFRSRKCSSKAEASTMPRASVLLFPPRDPRAHHQNLFTFCAWNPKGPESPSKGINYSNEE
jgi:hypothetical protein